MGVKANSCEILFSGLFSLAVTNVIMQDNQKVFVYLLTEQNAQNISREKCNALITLYYTTALFTLPGSLIFMDEADDLATVFDLLASTLNSSAYRQKDLTVYANK